MLCAVLGLVGVSSVAAQRAGARYLEATALAAHLVFPDASCSCRLVPAPLMWPYFVNALAHAAEICAVPGRTAVLYR